MSNKNTALTAKSKNGTIVLQGCDKYSHKIAKSKKRIHSTDTQSQAYAMTAELRATEERRARVFFIAHPNDTYSRADLQMLLKLPINHITRVVYDLLDSGFIERTGKSLNPRSGIRVEMLRLCGAKAEFSESIKRADDE